MKKKEINHFDQGPAETHFKWKITGFFLAIQDETVSCYESEIYDFPYLTCRFKLHPRSHPFPGFMNLYLEMRTKTMYYFSYNQYSVEYSYGLEAQDGTVEKVVRGIVTRGNMKCDKCFFKLSEIEERKSELAPLGVVTIMCKLKFYPSSFQPVMLDEPKLKKLRKLNTLSENFKSLFVNRECCDVTLRVMDKEYKAHSTVLIVRSSVFAAMFQQDTPDKQAGMITRHRKKKSQKMIIIPDGMITISDCDSESFEMFLKFLYCGELEDISIENALHLYEISHKYNVKELKVFCMEFLTENLTVENLCNIVIIADKYNDSKLSSATQDFFNDNIGQIQKKGFFSEKQVLFIQEIFAKKGIKNE